MNKHSRRLLRLGALLTLIPFSLYLLTSDGGMVYAPDLPSTWNTSFYTNLSGWTPRGSSSGWPWDEKRLLEAFRPGDRVRIYCRTFRMISGDEASLLVYIADGPAGLRRYGAIWNPLILAAIFLSTMLPLLLCSIIAIERDLRRDTAS